MKSVSDITGLEYEAENCVFFRRLTQCTYYIKMGASLIDIFTDSEDRLVFVFTKADHQRFKNAWSLANEKKLSEKVKVGE